MSPPLLCMPLSETCISAVSSYWSSHPSMSLWCLYLWLLEMSPGSQACWSLCPAEGSLTPEKAAQCCILTPIWAAAGWLSLKKEGQCSKHELINWSCWNPCCPQSNPLNSQRNMQILEVVYTCEDPSYRQVSPILLNSLSSPHTAAWFKACPLEMTIGVGWIKLPLNSTHPHQV